MVERSIGTLSSIEHTRKCGSGRVEVLDIIEIHTYTCDNRPQLTVYVSPPKSVRYLTSTLTPRTIRKRY